MAEASCDDDVYFEKIELNEESSNKVDCITMNYSVENLLPFQHYQFVLKLLSLMMINEDQDIKFICKFSIYDNLVHLCICLFE